MCGEKVITRCLKTLDWEQMVNVWEKGDYQMLKNVGLGTYGECVGIVKQYAKRVGTDVW